MARRRHVGLQGGSFNPVHLGHLRTAEEVREAAGLDEVWLVLARTPPHKHPGDVAEARHRRRMLELALGGAPGLRVETAELERPGPSYTVDTVRELAASHPDADFRLILGLDAFREVASWHRHEELLAACDLIVTSRPPEAVPGPPGALSGLWLPIAVAEAFWYDAEHQCYRHRSGRRLDFLAVTALDISASRIRELVRAGRSIRFLTPPDVVEYVAREGLYRACAT